MLICCRKMPNTRSGASMTREEFKELVTRRVAEEMEARETARTLEPLNENGDEQEGENRGNGNRGNRGNGNGGNRENGNGNRNGNHALYQDINNFRDIAYSALELLKQWSWALVECGLAAVD
ncbi:hypothetical protein Tco_0072403 [Tanacetum coccineum]